MKSIGERLLEKYGDMDVLFGTDYSQLEIRVLGQISGDEKLIAACRSGDVHGAVGHALTGKPKEQIKKDRDLRTAIKQTHFGIIFGMQPFGVFNKLKTDAAERGEQFSMSADEVTSLYNKYFETYRQVKKWIDGQHEFAEKNGYVSTMFGFIREIAIAGDESRNTFWANQAVNTPVQGSAHTLMLIALAIIGSLKKTYDLLQRPCMEVHDALYVFSKVKDIQRTYPQFKDLMEKRVLVYIKEWWPEINWVVPLEAEAKAGFRLGVMQEYTGQPIAQWLEEWCEKCRELEIKVRKEMAEAVTK